MNNRVIYRSILVVSAISLFIGMAFIVEYGISIVVSGIGYMLDNPLNVLMGSILGLILLTLYNSYIKST